MSIIDHLDKLVYILAGIFLVLGCLILPILSLIEGQQAVKMRVWIFPPQISIDVHLPNYLASVFQSGRQHAILFMAVIAVPPLWNNFYPADFLYVLFLFCVFYTNHPSDDIDSTSVVLSFNLCLLPLYQRQKPPNCVIFY